MSGPRHRWGAATPLRPGLMARSVSHAVSIPAPSVEPAAGGCGVDSRGPAERRAALRCMPPCVQEDAGDGVPHLAWSSQLVEVIVVGEGPPAAAEDPVDGSGEAGADRLHAAGQVAGARSLDDEMRVVVQRVVSDAEAIARRAR